MPPALSYNALAAASWHRNLLVRQSSTTHSFLSEGEDSDMELPGNWGENSEILGADGVGPKCSGFLVKSTF